MDLNGNCKISNFEFNDDIEIEKNRMRGYYRYDLLSLGYCVYQMISGSILSLDEFSCIILEDYTSEEKPDIDRLNISFLNISNEAKIFLEEFLEKKAYYFKDNITKSITLGLKKNKFFSEINWTKLEMGELESPFKPNKVKILKIKKIY